MLYLENESNNSSNVFKLTPDVFIGSQPRPDKAFDFQSVSKEILDLLNFQA